MRILIAGGPKTGKTTLAGTLGLPVKHTDDATGSWESRIVVVTGWLDELPPDGIIEGVLILHVLEPWLKAHKGKPADQVLFLKGAHLPLTPGQQNMTKGINTVWARVEPELIRRGVNTSRSTLLPMCF